MLAEWYRGQAVLQARGQHDAAHHRGQQQQDGVHDPAGYGAVAHAGAAAADGTCCLAKTASSCATKGDYASHGLSE